VVRNGVERLWNANVVVGLIRAFGNHDKSGDPGNVGLIGNRKQVEKKVNLFVEVVLFPHGAFRNLHTRDVNVRDETCASFDLAHALRDTHPA
jgi:hypothetical protein